MQKVNITDKRHKKKRRQVGVRLKANERVLRPMRIKKNTSLQYGQSINKAVIETKRKVMQQYSDLGLIQFEQILNQVYDDLNVWDNAELAANDMVYNTNIEHKNAFYKAAQDAVGFNFRKFINEEGLDEIMGVAINENVLAISDLETSSQRRIAELVNRALILQTGKTVSLEQELLRAFDIDKRKAKFIARDQTQRFSSSLNKFRQEKAGVKKYMWITSKDSRVRPSHQANSRKIFSWDTEPAITGHPGNDYNCRCTGSAILEII